MRQQRQPCAALRRHVLLCLCFPSHKPPVLAGPPARLCSTDGLRGRRLACLVSRATECSAAGVLFLRASSPRTRHVRRVHICHSTCIARLPTSRRGRRRQLGRGGVNGVSSVVSPLSLSVARLPSQFRYDESFLLPLPSPPPVPLSALCLRLYTHVPVPRRPPSLTLPSLTPSLSARPPSPTGCSGLLGPRGV